MNWELIGWMGSCLLAVCSLPQAYKTFKTKDVTGLSFMMLITMTFGCLFAFIYGYHSHVPRQVILSYIVNGIASLALTVAYIIFRKKS